MIIKGIKLKERVSKLYTSHTMTTFLDFSPNLINWVQKMKDVGYNNIWAYTDFYQNKEVNNIQYLLDACQTVGNITVTVGAHGANAGQRDIDMMLNTKDHPAILRIGGKPVYTYYGWDKTQYQSTINLLSANGINRSDFILLVNTQYAANAYWRTDLKNQFQNGTIISPHYEPEPTNKTFFYYQQEQAVIIENVSSYVQDEVSINYMLDTYGIDGIVNFAVDKGGIDIINENEIVQSSALFKNKLYMGGVSGYYASVSFQDYGFDNVAGMWQSMIDKSPSSRPFAISDTTSDDYVELSYMSPTLTPTVNGLSFMPEISKGFHLGNNTRVVLTDHSGLIKFLRPFIDAYKNNTVTISITTEKIFAWYHLHPVDAPLIPTIPSEAASLGVYFTQEWWSNTLYAQGNQNVTGIKAYLSEGMNTIRMAAHLTNPAYLKINNTLSSLKGAGLAYFEIPQVLGIPTFSIVNTDGTTVRKTGAGPQAITNSCYPGGWNPLITEI